MFGFESKEQILEAVRGVLVFFLVFDFLLFVDRLADLICQLAQLGEHLWIDLAGLCDFGPQGVERFEESLFVHTRSLSWQPARRNQVGRTTFPSSSMFVVGLLS